MHTSPELCLAEYRRADIAAQAQLTVGLQADVGVVDLAVLAVVDVTVFERVGIGGLLEAPDQGHADHLAGAPPPIGVAVVGRPIARHPVAAPPPGTDHTTA